MRRMLAVGVLVAATLTGVATPAAAGFTSATFGETGTLTADGRVAVVSLRLACTDGRVSFTVDLTQGSVSGVTRGAAWCEHPDVIAWVPSHDTTEFPNWAPGTARACVQVIFQEPGGGEETYIWCSDVLLQSERPKRG